MEPQEFLQRMAEGEKERQRVMSELYPELLRRVQHTCRAGGFWRADEMNDVVQNTVIAMLTKWDTFRGESSLWTWVWQISSNLIRNIHRQQARLKSLDAMRDDAKEQNRAPVDEESYEFAGEQQLCVGQVLDFLDKEPPPRKGAKRTIDLLRFTVEFGSDTEALAAFLGTSQGAAKERKRYALQKIRELCLRFCGAENCAIGTAS